MCAGFAEVEVAPSPKFQLYDSGDPSGSDEPALEKVTASGAAPPNVFAPAVAVGGRFTPTVFTVMVMLGETVELVPSDTFNDAL